MTNDVVFNVLVFNVMWCSTAALLVANCKYQECTKDKPSEQWPCVNVERSSRSVLYYNFHWHKHSNKKMVIYVLRKMVSILWSDTSHSLLYQCYYPVSETGTLFYKIFCIVMVKPYTYLYVFTYIYSDLEMEAKGLRDVVPENEFPFLVADTGCQLFRGKHSWKPIGRYLTDPQQYFWATWSIWENKEG